MTPIAEPLARFSLPPPPSTNALFTTRKGSRQRIKTDAYRRWIKEAGWVLVNQTSLTTAISGSVRVHIDLPFSRRRDIDNAIKPIADLLVSCAVVEDDRWVDEYLVRRVAVGEPLTVSVWRIE